MTEERIGEIVTQVAQKFPSFGGRDAGPRSIISATIANKPPEFAMGVRIEDVVRFVINSASAEIKS